MKAPNMSHAESLSGPRDLRFTLFRLVAFVEGVTTVALFFVAMPMKYIWFNGWGVHWAGPIHGYAFLAYLVMMVVGLWGRGWSLGDWGRTALVSFVPLGTFFNDPWLVRRAAR